jgi:hypothetical protein
MPVVSVVMLCHRDTVFLRPAIASVFGQTLRDLELVLVDNGVGLTAAQLGEGGRDPRLRWVRFECNRGIPAGLNTAIAASRSEFIALLDHDDIMLPPRLERQVARLRERPALGLVSSLAETIDAEGRVTGREFSLVAGEAQRRYTQYANPVVTPAYTGRRELFAALPFRTEFPLATDFDFFARAAEQSTLEAVPEVLLHYRRHATQTSVEYAGQMAAEQGVIRLLTARRRAARAEDLAGAAALLDGLRQNQPALGAIHARCATWCLEERFAALAVYHARKAFAAQRDAKSLGTALGLYAAALRMAPREAVRLSRLFFTGPLRALGLKPA